MVPMGTKQAWMWHTLRKLTCEESAWLEDWLVPEFKVNPEVFDLEDTSNSFVGWLLDVEASFIDEPFFTRFEPAVVETFQTSWIKPFGIPIPLEHKWKK